MGGGGRVVNDVNMRVWLGVALYLCVAVRGKQGVRVRGEGRQGVQELDVAGSG